MIKKKVLIADDNPEILEIVKIILEDEGFEVEVTLNGKDLLKLKEDFPDIILLDIRMSGIDGNTIAKFLKNQESSRNIPIIMISANRDTQATAAESGADDFLCKPFELEELISKVRKYTN